MNIKRVILTLTTSALGIVLMLPVTADASSWHKGTPKAIRGVWFLQEKDRWTSFEVTKKDFGVGHMGMPAVTVWHPFYKKTKSAYILKGYAKANGLWLGANIKYKVVKRGRHIHIKSIKKTIYDNITLYKTKF
ncbi:hypothetical protein [Levilactobacillus spicheri]|uniref:DUF5626 domain-containing protein n=1 Tax=Levilactobacillus spicheri TaxID=216463 RepID=A0ABQ0WQM9_9LACO|nr:hypothetical protein [Levilactobacillus spicheri]GEO65890.1 hypothetical protein LSP04_03090 [Levilactobacillus spicheri]